MNPGIDAIDPDHEARDGHDRSKNMKLDGQLDYCNEHAGRGFDIHYHADPICMYDDSESGHSPLIGWAADGFGLYGKYDAGHAHPGDLDRCMGHFGPTPTSNRSYHYHVSPKFPYTIACWRGNVSAMPLENGGQPGQKQWAFDNMRERTDYDMLYPCCADGSPDARAPAFVDAMRPYEPVDEDNFDYRDASAPAHAWMFAKHADFGADEFARADPASNTCAGKSAGLHDDDCAAWHDVFDATGGNSTWKDCGDLRDDPCGCLNENGEVACATYYDGSKRVVGLYLGANGLSGSLPASLAKMTAVTDLQLEGNGRRGPGTVGLGGVLPPLNFSQYFGCGLELNDFACPLPPGAKERCSAGQPMTCL